MTPLAAVPNLIQQAYDRILTAIVDHSLAPGSRIRQLELAERLGVSRQPVSHALHLLHRQGLVVESGRKGFQVTPLEGAGIRRLYAVRGALDGLAASLAAGRAAHDAAGRAALEAALTTGQATDAAAPLADLIERDVTFHSALYRLSGNPAIAETVGPQWPVMRRAMAAVLIDENHRAQVWVEHRSIVERVLAGDADGAERAARDHASNAGRVMEERLTPRQAAA